jgi:hypothetical protein
MYKKVNLIKEDTEMLYNRWVSGIAKKEAPPEVITVADIQNRFRNNSNYSAPKILPFPLSMFLDFIGNIFVKSAELRRLLGSSLSYPLIREDVEKINAVKNLNEKMKQIQDIIYSCSEDLTKLISLKK